MPSPLLAGAGRILKSGAEHVRPALQMAGQRARAMGERVPFLRKIGASSGGTAVPSMAPPGVPRVPHATSAPRPAPRPVTKNGGLGSWKNPDAPASSGTGGLGSWKPGRVPGTGGPGGRPPTRNGGLGSWNSKGQHWNPTTKSIPTPTASSSGAAAATKGPGWIRRNPGLALGGAAVGLGAMNLRRNTGPGVTGNGYMPTGSSSGGRGY